MENPKKCLVVPSVYHPWRMAVITQYLQELGWEVEAAVSPTGKAVFSREFPGMRLHDFLPYKEFQSDFWPSWVKRFTDLFRYGHAMKYESARVEKKVKEGGFSFVCADDRIGAYALSVPSLLWLDYPFYDKNYFGRYSDAAVTIATKRFTEVWLPDWQTDKNLLGPTAIEVPGTVKYVGPVMPLENPDTGKEFAVAVWLAGPEPYRMVLERILSVQLSVIPGRKIIIRNTEEKDADIMYRDDFEVKDFVSLREWEYIAGNAAVILGRPDYHVVSTLVAAGRQGILIGTDNSKAEKMWMAHHIDYRNFYSQEQYNMDIRDAFHKLQWYTPMEYPLPAHGWKQALSEFLENKIR